jgi:ankyrin repeat protein
LFDLSGNQLNLFTIMQSGASKEEKVKQLHNLTEESDLKQLCSFLVDIEDEVLNSEDRQGSTALATAASRGKADVCSVLIEHGVNVQCSDEEGNSPLHHFARRGDLEMVKKLVDCGADVDVHNQDGESALATAAGHGKTDICLLLIEHEANIRCSDKERNSPLHHFARRGDLELMKMLVDRGVDLHGKNKDGESALDCSRNQLLCAAFLMAHGATLPVDSVKRADFLSYFGGNWLVTLVLVKKFDFDINVLDTSGMSALHEMVTKNRLEAVKNLTELGANPNFKNSRGESAILIASKNGFTDISAFFLVWHENQKIKENKVKIGERIDGKTSGFPAVCDATYTIGGVEEEVVVKILMAMNDAERKVLEREAKILLNKVTGRKSKEVDQGIEKSLSPSWKQKSPRLVNKFI